MNDFSDYTEMREKEKKPKNKSILWNDGHSKLIQLFIAFTISISFSDSAISQIMKITVEDEKGELLNGVLMTSCKDLNSR